MQCSSKEDKDWCISAAVHEHELKQMSADQLLRVGTFAGARVKGYKSWKFIIIIIIINGTTAQTRALASLTGFVMILRCGLSAPRST
jgi:hypothetical protein